MFKLIIVYCIFIFLPLISYAADISFGGSVQSETHSYWQELPDPTRTYDQIINLTPNFSLKGESDRIVINPHLRVNTSTDYTKEKAFINVKEAYWEYKNYPLKTKVGMNTYSWGSMDGYSPVDMVNSKAYFNPLNPEKLGAPTVDLLYETDSWQFQAIYIVKQPRTILPSPDSRWLPREVLVNTQTTFGTILLPSSFNYYYPFTEELNNPRDHNYGFNISGRFSDFDFALIYFEGNSPMPQIRPVITIATTSQPDVYQASGDVGIAPVFYRQRLTGAKLVWAPGEYIVRFETAYTNTISKASDIPAWFWQNALGIETSYAIGSSTLTVLAQGYYGKNDDLIDNLISSNNRIFDQAALVGLRLGLSTTTSFLLSAMYDIKSNSYFAHGSFTTKLWDTIEAELIVDNIQGKKESMLGSYNKNDRAILMLGYSW